MVEILETGTASVDMTLQADRGTKRQSTMIVKNLAQMLELKAFERMVSEIYGQPLEFAELLTRVDCEAHIIDQLAGLSFAPVCSALLERMRDNLTLTDEGKRLFDLAIFVYGFHGLATTSSTTVSVRMRVTLTEAKQLMVRLKARLQAPQVRVMLEQCLREEINRFKKSEVHQDLSLTSFAPEPGAGEFTRNEHAQTMLTALSCDIIEALQSHNTINISGSSGSGKTSAAIEAALNLANQGKSVLLVNHSRMLAAHLRQNPYISDNQNITVATFHAHCHAAATAAGLKPPKFRSAKVFNEILPELLVEANYVMPALQFDAVIIDEGHGFTASMWRSLKHCLKDSINGIFMFFYDQKVMTFNKLAVVPFATRTITLEHGFRPDLLAHRSTCEIFDAADETEQIETVQFLVDDILATGVAPADIAILSAGNDKKLLRYKFASGVRICQSISKVNRQAITHSTLFNFRGLTAPVVIINVNDDVAKLSQWKLESLSYLAFGRATERIILVGRQDIVRKLLPGETATVTTAEITSEFTSILKPSVFQPSDS